ncbi:MAG: ImpB/MucB/SamB family protein [Crocinitomicaceae bacterium]|nr:ImpB/MucB/SamB family protein [Crocinitomicaceae bacterium]
MSVALVDCVSFYASCERVFRPDLKNKPIVVLSNNDGCVIARSPEAKAMGVKMGVPWFKIKDMYIRKGGIVFSSNFAFYGDMSRRVMNILDSVSSKIEVYSIDEAFLDFSGTEKNIGCFDFGLHLKNVVGKWTGIPVRIGVGPTKTLAKIASYQIKRKKIQSRVLVLDSQREIVEALKNTPVGEIWGVGKRLNRKLSMAGIKNALQLSCTPPQDMRKRFSIVLERTVRELNGEKCLDIEDVSPAKKQIVVSRSFAKKITNLEVLNTVVNDYVVRAAEKLRSERQKSSTISVFIRTSPFDTNEYYRAIKSYSFTYPTDDSRDFLYAVRKILPKIYKPNHRYSKAGIMLSSFSDIGYVQNSLFKENHAYKMDSKLMKVIDELNLHQKQIYIASQNIGRFKPIQRNMISPKYTTRWSDLPLVK